MREDGVRGSGRVSHRWGEGWALLLLRQNKRRGGLAVGVRDAV